MKVICEVCKKEFLQITPGHLKTHSMTIEEYRIKFPDSKLVSEEASQTKSQSACRIWTTEAKLKEREEKKNKRKRVCKNCGCEFIMDFGEQNKYFCSKDCYISFSRKNSTNYRMKAFELLPNKCFYCDEEDVNKLEIHHRDRDSYNDDITNLMILCTKHHKAVHKKDSLLSKNTTFKESQILEGLKLVMKGLGLDLNDPNFKDTPFRVLKSYYEIFEGLYSSDEIKCILETNFPSNYSGIIVSKNIHCFSVCPHHLLPVEYYVDLGYIPSDKMLGISKLTRLVELLAKKPMLQEEFTFQVIDMLNQYIVPKGAIVQIRGRHFCMVMRGVKQDSWTYTNKISGIFETDDSAKAEFQLMTQR